MISVKSEKYLSGQEKIEISQIIYQCFLKDDPNYNLDRCPISKLPYGLNIMTIYLYKIDEQIVGVAHLHDLDNPNVHFLNSNTKIGENISSVAVLEKYRRQGIASKILDKIIQDNHKKMDLVLNVHKKEKKLEGILQCYKKSGFIVDEKGTDEHEYYLRLPKKRKVKKRLRKRINRQA